MYLSKNDMITFNRTYVSRFFKDNFLIQNVRFLCIFCEKVLKYNCFLYFCA